MPELLSDFFQLALGKITLHFAISTFDIISLAREIQLPVFDPLFTTIPILISIGGEGQEGVE